MGILEAILQILAVVGVVVFALSYRWKPAFLGPLGHCIIGLGCANFLTQILGYAFDRAGSERLILILGSLIGTPIIALYWVRVWNQMRPDRKNQK